MIPRPIRLLFQRNYGLLWWSGFVSDAGTWMQTVAVGALVTELTGSAGWGAWVAAVTYLMSGLVTPYGGVLADHHDRRRLLMIIGVFQAVIAVALAITYMAGDVSPFVVLVFVALEGACVAIALPARSALLPAVVDRSDLESATALGSASWNLGRMIGPALAGVVVLLGSYTPIFLINAATFVLLAVAMFFIRIPPTVRDERTTGAFERVKDGFRTVRAEPGCWLSVRIMAFVGVLVSPFIALVPAMGQIVFKGGPEATAQLVVAQGIGAVIGAFGINLLMRRLGRNRAIRMILMVVPVTSIAYALSPSLAIATGAMVVLGTFYVWTLVCLNVVIQLRVNEAHRGRALSLLFGSLSLFYPLGAAVLGWLADHVGVREVLVSGAAIYLVGMIAFSLLRSRSMDSLDALPPARLDLSEDRATTVT